MGGMEKGVLRVVKQVVVPAVDLNARRCMKLISYSEFNAPLVIVFAERQCSSVRKAGLS